VATVRAGKKEINERVTMTSYVAWLALAGALLLSAAPLLLLQLLLLLPLLLYEASQLMQNAAWVCWVCLSMLFEALAARGAAVAMGCILLLPVCGCAAAVCAPP
jgi:hypothetical protein